MSIYRRYFTCFNADSIFFDRIKRSTRSHRHQFHISEFLLAFNQPFDAQSAKFVPLHEKYFPSYSAAAQLSP